MTSYFSEVVRYLSNKGKLVKWSDAVAHDIKIQCCKIAAAKMNLYKNVPGSMQRMGPGTNIGYTFQSEISPTCSLTWPT